MHQPPVDLLARAQLKATLGSGWDSFQASSLPFFLEGFHACAWRPSEAAWAEPTCVNASVRNRLSKALQYSPSTTFFQSVKFPV